MMPLMTSCATFQGSVVSQVGTVDSFCAVDESIIIPKNELDILRKAPITSRGILRENLKNHCLCGKANDPICKSQNP